MAKYRWTVNYIALIVKPIFVHWHAVPGIVHVILIVVFGAVLRKYFYESFLSEGMEKLAGAHQGVSALQTGTSLRVFHEQKNQCEPQPIYQCVDW
jgi:hypothetical protein